MHFHLALVPFGCSDNPVQISICPESHVTTDIQDIHPKLMNDRGWDESAFNKEFDQKGLEEEADLRLGTVFQ